MTPTKARDLAGIGVVVAAISWVLVREYYGSLPPIGWYVPLSLAVLGLSELIGARVLQARIRADSGLPPVQALQAARALALAKASSVAGSGLVGLWLGFLAYTAAKVGVLAAAGDDTLTGTVGVASSGLLVAGALVLENACRTPPPPKHRNDRF